MKTAFPLFAMTVLAMHSLPALAVDELAANDLLKESRCTKCHAVAREKVGPPFREVAAKYKGKAEAMGKLTKHITVPSEVEIDGKKDDHGLVSSTDPAQVKNLVEWILSH